MGENTAIEWATHTFNPWIGCTKVSAACDNCYAESYAARYKRAEWGAGKPRSLTSDTNWKTPLMWARKAREKDEDLLAWCAKEGLGPAEFERMRGRPRERPRVFCASLADVFDTEVDQAWRERLWSLIAETPELDWLLLTKRPHVAGRSRLDGGLPWIRANWTHADGAWPNVWLGTTVESQKVADVRVNQLMEIPVALRFLSMEPLLEAVDVRPWLMQPRIGCPDLDPNWPRSGAQFGDGNVKGPRKCILYPSCECGERDREGEHIAWVIAGGESGPGARPMHPDWARSLRDQCAKAKVPFLFKQWGDLYTRLNGDVVRLGKKTAGRLLDDVTHDGIPESPAARAA